MGAVRCEYAALGKVKGTQLIFILISVHLEIAS
jgi:hypothetical protein